MFLFAFAAAATVAAVASAQTSAPEDAKPPSQMAPDPRLQKPDAPATPDSPDAAKSGKLDPIPNIIIEKEKSELNPQNDQEILERIAALPDSIQKEVMDEARHAKSYCEESGFIGTFYDCSCYSLHLADTRISKGPDVAFVDLLYYGRYKDCVSMPQIAGYGLKRCDDIITGTPATTGQMNQICECTGRMLARNYASTPILNVGYVENLFTQVFGYCRSQYGF